MFAFRVIAAREEPPEPAPLLYKVPAACRACTVRNAFDDGDRAVRPRPHILFVRALGFAGADELFTVLGPPQEHLLAAFVADDIGFLFLFFEALHPLLRA